METVTPAVVALSRTRERHRSPERVLELVRDALTHLGGLECFIGRGQTVLLKPNQTVFYSAEEGCTTDPLVVGALIRLAKEAGARRVLVGEASGGFFSSLECMRITGVAAVAEREGAKLVDLGSDRTPNRTVSIPRGRVTRRAPLPAPLLDADVVINVPKAKNHHVDPISGALKNWLGAVNQQWREQHHGDADVTGRFMDLMSARPPDLNVVDALIVGEGDGPIANLPRWCGCILAACDPVATDAALCRLLGHDPGCLCFAIEAEARGLGIREPLEWRGVPLEEAAIQAWPGHVGFDYLPVNFIVGEGVRLEGTVGHVKSVLDSMLRRGELRQVIWTRGTPTIMIGAAEDPNFEAHLEEGPYVVFDDAARPEYKHHPRVHFVPGHPVLRQAMPELLRGLGIAPLGKGALKWQQFQRWGMQNLAYGTPRRKALTLARPLAAAGLAVAGAAGARALARRFFSGDGRDGGERDA